MHGVRYYKNLIDGLILNYKSSVNVNKRLLIIESDDWGAIRTPSAQSVDAFNKHGLDLTNSIYKIDALASEEDLNKLFDLLMSHKNREGKSPVITANSIMANPDFQRIKESEFSTYYSEPFTETLRKYPEHKNSLQLWKKGEELGIFYPEYHGMEHLNITRWMNALRKADKKVRYTFGWNSTYSGDEDYSFMEAFDWDKPEEVDDHRKRLLKGADIFKNTFGRKASSFIAPCYCWDSNIEHTLSQIGIEWVQGVSNQYSPTGSFEVYNPVKHFFGEINQFNTRFNIRNVFFEPSNNPNINWVDSAMARINAAFVMKKPAVICSHRLNYIGFISASNRDFGLESLNNLLTRILKKWPDVQFITTSELTKYIN